jgi:hypothetical protein
MHLRRGRKDNLIEGTFVDCSTVDSERDLVLRERLHSLWKLFDPPTLSELHSVIRLLAIWVVGGEQKDLLIKVFTTHCGIFNLIQSNLS